MRNPVIYAAPLAPNHTKDLTLYDTLPLPSEASPPSYICPPMGDLDMRGRLPQGFHLCRCLPRVKGMPSTTHGRHFHIGIGSISTTRAKHLHDSCKASPQPVQSISTRTEAQKASLRRLLADLHRRYPHARIVGHHDLNPQKACPCIADVAKEYADLQPK